MYFSLDEYQVMLNDWQKKNFGIIPPVLLALGLAKEAGKVTGAILDNAQNLTPYETPLDHIDRIKDALADTVVFCLQLYSAYGIKAEESLSDVFEYILSMDKNKLISDKFSASIEGQPNIEKENETPPDSKDNNSVFER